MIASAEFIALGMTTEIIVIFKDENAGLAAGRFTEKMGRREPAESPADHHKVVRLTAIDRLARRVPEGSVAQAVSYLKRPHMATAQAS